MKQYYYKTQSFLKGLPLFLGMIFLSSSASAQCTINGSDLLAYPGATFPTITPTTTGTSLSFGAGSSNDEIIMTFPVVPSGTLLSTSDFTVNVLMYMKRISSDNDPIMGITDGNATDFSGIIANDGSSHFDVNGTLTGNNASIAYTTIGACNGSCGSAVGDTYSVDMTFSVVSGVTSVTFTTEQGANTSTSTSTYPQVYDPSTGINFALLRQSSGETYQVDSVVIACATAPTINSISPDAFVCEGADTLLSVSASGGASTSYQWQLGGVDVPGATNDTLDFSPTGIPDAGAYTCIVSNMFGSDTTSVINFFVNPSPTASISGPTSICLGDSVLLTGNVTGGTAPYTFGWTPTGSTLQNPTVSPASDTTYTFKVTDTNGCMSVVDSLEITVNSLPTVSIVADSTICSGESAMLVATAGGGNNPYVYTWNPGGLSTDTVIVNPTSTTMYTVSVSDSNTCAATESATVIVYAGPTSSFTYTETGIDTVWFASTSTGAISWSWDFDDGSTSTLENPEHVYTAAGSYTACLTATDTNGCTNTMCQTILVGSAGINSNDPFDQVYLYPNPADQYVNLVVDNGTKSILITDISGRVVYEASNPIEKLIQIPVEEWSNGVYTIRITNEKSGTSVGRLSVSH